MARTRAEGGSPAAPQDNDLYDCVSSPRLNQEIERNAASLSVTWDDNGNSAQSGRFGRRRSSVSNQSMEQSHFAAQRARPRLDEETLAQSIADAGLNAFGCIFVEMWVLSEDGTKFTRPDGGHWMNPAFATSLPNDDLIEQAWELDRKAEDCPPGAGLAGILADESGLGSGQVHWRQIKVLLKDPFVQRGAGRRMARMFEVGIGLVASVPFSFIDGKGLVLFYSRTTADSEALQDPANVRYMISSANLIGAGFSIRKSRDHMAESRRKKYLGAIGKVRRQISKDANSLAGFAHDSAAMKTLKNLQASEEADQDEEGFSGTNSSSDLICVKIAKAAHWFGAHGLKRISNSTKKWRGSKLHGPPTQSFSASLFAFIGVFLTMLTVLKVEKTLEASGDFGDFNMNINGGWYASTLCILFALTPAPVGQPRQIVLAHLWNIIVGLACKQIPGGDMGDFMEFGGAGPGSVLGMPLIWRQSLAVALGVSGQAFLGILHPPATGLSFVFASDPLFTWSTIAPVLLVDVVVVILSMAILNLSEKQQYPLWWLGLGYASSGGSLNHLKRVVRRE